MKNIFFALVLIIFAACTSRSSQTSHADSMSGIETHPVQDTTIDTLPNGYTPPNDSTAGKTDSVRH